MTTYSSVTASFVLAPRDATDRVYWDGYQAGLEAGYHRGYTEALDTRPTAQDEADFHAMLNAEASDTEDHR